mgnify:CR=1 FL=1
MHTPGPWMFDGDSPANQGFDIAMPDGGTLATAYYDIDRDAYSVQQAEGNARLIAAAPDLLAACKVVAAAASKILLLSEKYTNAGSAAYGVACTLKRLVLDAIKKAEGGKS